MTTSDEETRLLYLLSGSCDVLPPSCIKLRSYMNIHMSNVADQHNLRLLKSFRNRNKTCPYCYSPWSGDTTSFKLLPSKRPGRHKARSKIGENENNETSQSSESRNTLVLKCKVCSKKSSFSLVKRKPVEVTPKVEKVEIIKKKKKKKDKFCGLAVNLIKNESNSPEVVVIKKKKRMEDGEKIGVANPTHPQSIQSQKSSPIPKSSASGTSKNLVLNPFAAQVQKEFQGKKKNKKLERLKQAVKEEKNTAKKTLKDFLTLI